jgi:hypothetical protein
VFVIKFDQSVVDVMNFPLDKAKSIVLAYHDNDEIPLHYSSIRLIGDDNWDEAMTIPLDFFMNEK